MLTGLMSTSGSNISDGVGVLAGNVLLTFWCVHQVSKTTYFNLFRRIFLGVKWISIDDTGRHLVSADPVLESVAIFFVGHRNLCFYINSNLHWEPLPAIYL